MQTCDQLAPGCTAVLRRQPVAHRAGLGELAGEHVRIGPRCGVNAQVKMACLVAGMAAGADCIDLDVLRHGAMPSLFEGIRAPSTLGSFLRSFTGGHARQAERSAGCCWPTSRHAPLLPGTPCG